MAISRSGIAVGGEGSGSPYGQILQALLRLTSYRPRLNQIRGNLVKLRAQAPLYGRDDALEDLVKLLAQAPLRDAVRESLERADTSHLRKELRWGHKLG
jgi:MoxR-like ATPase